MIKNDKNIKKIEEKKERLCDKKKEIDTDQLIDI